MIPIRIPVPVILASGSPRRKELLIAAGFTFDVVPSNAQEIIPQGIHPEDAAAYLSELKSLEVFQKNLNSLVIGADTLVLIEDKILAKPANDAEAFEMINSLSGKTHLVITGVTVLAPGFSHTFSDQTKVTFSALSEEEIRWYIAQYRPFDKAGAYGIQEWIGLIGISRIEGDYFNVVGLPVNRLWNTIKLYLEHYGKA